MADCLGGRLDPTEGYENDVCVYLLGFHHEPEPEYAYYDVMDCGYARLSRIRGRTKGGIIAVSRAQHREFLEAFPGRQIHLIPHHHCNYENEKRPERPVRTVGCCGGDGAVQWPHYRIEAWLQSMDLKWSITNEYLRRERVVDFYKTIDIQFVWRPTHKRGIAAHTNPLKLSNAGSFGIPTVCFPEPAFTAEWVNGCIYAENMTEAMRKIRQLAEDAAWYEEMSQRAKRAAAGYHISRIAECYRALPGAA